MIKEGPMDPTYLPAALLQAADATHAKEARKNGPIDPQGIAARHGIRTVFAQFDDSISDDLGAFYDAEDRMIYVNQALDGKEKNFVIAVELGKAILFPQWSASEDYEVSHRKGNGKTRQHQDAMKFARYLLVPQRHVKALEKARYTLFRDCFVLPEHHFLQALADLKALSA